MHPADIIFAVMAFITVVLLVMLIVMAPKFDEATFVANFERNCNEKWSSFETRVLKTISAHGSDQYICQISHEGKWIPTDNFFIKE